jgi:hypothetical protein
MILRFLRWLSSKLTLYPIPRREGGLYMERYHRGETHEDKHVFLNKINFKDQDGAHNHPYTWCASLILTRYYAEQTLNTKTGEWSHRWRWAWSINWIPRGKYHRISYVPSEGVWTLFICGPKHGNSWGFWEPGVGHIHNQEYKMFSPETNIMWNEEGWWHNYTSAYSQGPFETRDACKRQLYCAIQEVLR